MSIKRHVHLYSFICNDQNLEITQMSIDRWMDKSFFFTSIQWNTTQQYKGINYYYTQYGCILKYLCRVKVPRPIDECMLNVLVYKKFQKVKANLKYVVGFLGMRGGGARRMDCQGTPENLYRQWICSLSWLWGWFHKFIYICVCVCVCVCFKIFKVYTL